MNMNKLSSHGGLRRKHLRSLRVGLPRHRMLTRVQPKVFNANGKCGQSMIVAAERKRRHALVQIAPGKSSRRIGLVVTSSDMLVMPSNENPRFIED